MEPDTVNEWNNRTASMILIFEYIRERESCLETFLDYYALEFLYLLAHHY